MVKFGELLEAEMAVEWREKYIDYKRLKALLEALNPDVKKKDQDNAVRALTLLRMQDPYRSQAAAPQTAGPPAAPKLQAPAPLPVHPPKESPVPDHPSVDAGDSQMVTVTEDDYTSPPRANASETAPAPLFRSLTPPRELYGTSQLMQRRRAVMMVPPPPVTSQQLVHSAGQQFVNTTGQQVMASGPQFYAPNGVPMTLLQYPPQQNATGPNTTPLQPYSLSRPSHPLYSSMNPYPQPHSVRGALPAQGQYHTLPPSRPFSLSHPQQPIIRDDVAATSGTPVDAVYGSNGLGSNGSSNGPGRVSVSSSLAVPGLGHAATIGTGAIARGNIAIGSTSAAAGTHTSTHTDTGMGTVLGRSNSAIELSVADMSVGSAVTDIATQPVNTNTNTTATNKPNPCTPAATGNASTTSTSANAAAGSTAAGTTSTVLAAPLAPAPHLYTTTARASLPQHMHTYAQHYTSSSQPSVAYTASAPRGTPSRRRSPYHGPVGSQTPLMSARTPGMGAHTPQMGAITPILGPLGGGAGGMGVFGGADFQLNGVHTAATAMSSNANTNGSNGNSGGAGDSGMTPLRGAAETAFGRNGARASGKRRNTKFLTNSFPEVPPLVLPVSEASFTPSSSSFSPTPTSATNTNNNNTTGTNTDTSTGIGADATSPSSDSTASEAAADAAVAVQLNLTDDKVLTTITVAPRQQLVKPVGTTTSRLPRHPHPNAVAIRSAQGSSSFPHTHAFSLSQHLPVPVPGSAAHTRMPNGYTPHASPCLTPARPGQIPSGSFPNAQIPGGALIPGKFASGQLYSANGQVYTSTGHAYGAHGQVFMSNGQLFVATPVTVPQHLSQQQQQVFTSASVSSAVSTPYGTTASAHTTPGHRSSLHRAPEPTAMQLLPLPASAFSSAVFPASTALPATGYGDAAASGGVGGVLGGVGQSHSGAAVSSHTGMFLLPSSHASAPGQMPPQGQAQGQGSQSYSSSSRPSSTQPTRPLAPHHSRPVSTAPARPISTQHTRPQVLPVHMIPGPGISGQVIPGPVPMVQPQVVQAAAAAYPMSAYQRVFMQQFQQKLLLQQQQRQQQQGQWMHGPGSGHHTPSRMRAPANATAAAGVGVVDGHFHQVHPHTQAQMQMQMHGQGQGQALVPMSMHVQPHLYTPAPAAPMQPAHPTAPRRVLPRLSRDYHPSPYLPAQPPVLYYEPQLGMGVARGPRVYHARLCAADDLMLPSVTATQQHRRKLQLRRKMAVQQHMERVGAVTGVVAPSSMAANAVEGSTSAESGNNTVSATDAAAAAATEAPAALALATTVSTADVSTSTFTSAPACLTPVSTTAIASATPASATAFTSALTTTAASAPTAAGASTGDDADILGWSVLPHPDSLAAHTHAPSQTQTLPGAGVNAGVLPFSGVPLPTNTATTTTATATASPTTTVADVASPTDASSSLSLTLDIPQHAPARNGDVQHGVLAFMEGRGMGGTASDGPTVGVGLLSSLVADTPLPTATTAAPINTAMGPATAAASSSLPDSVPPHPSTLTLSTASPASPGTPLTPITPITPVTPVVHASTPTVTTAVTTVAATGAANAMVNTETNAMDVSRAAGVSATSPYKPPFRMPLNYDLVDTGLQYLSLNTNNSVTTAASGNVIAGSADGSVDATATQTLLMSPSTPPTVFSPIPNAHDAATAVAPVLFSPVPDATVASTLSTSPDMMASVLGAPGIFSPIAPAPASHSGMAQVVMSPVAFSPVLGALVGIDTGLDTAATVPTGNGTSMGVGGDAELLVTSPIAAPTPTATIPASTASTTAHPTGNVILLPAATANITGTSTGSTISSNAGSTSDIAHLTRPRAASALLRPATERSFASGSFLTRNVALQLQRRKEARAAAASSHGGSTVGESIPDGNGSVPGSVGGSLSSDDRGKKNQLQVTVSPPGPASAAGGFTSTGKPGFPIKSGKSEGEVFSQLDFPISTHSHVNANHLSHLTRSRSQRHGKLDHSRVHSSSKRGRIAEDRWGNTSDPESTQEEFIPVHSRPRIHVAPVRPSGVSVLSKLLDSDDEGDRSDKRCDNRHTNERPERHGGLNDARMWEKHTRDRSWKREFVAVDEVEDLDPANVNVQTKTQRYHSGEKPVERSGSGKTNSGKGLPGNIANGDARPSRPPRHLRQPVRQEKDGNKKNWFSGIGKILHSSDSGNSGILNFADNLDDIDTPPSSPSPVSSPSPARVVSPKTGILPLGKRNSGIEDPLSPRGDTSKPLLSSDRDREDRKINLDSRNNLNSGDSVRSSEHGSIRAASTASYVSSPRVVKVADDNVDNYRYPPADDDHDDNHDHRDGKTYHTQENTRTTPRHQILHEASVPRFSEMYTSGAENHDSSQNVPHAPRENPLRKISSRASLAALEDSSVDSAHVQALLRTLMGGNTSIGIRQRRDSFVSYSSEDEAHHPLPHTRSFLGGYVPGDVAGDVPGDVSRAHAPGEGRGHVGHGAASLSRTTPRHHGKAAFTFGEDNSRTHASPDMQTPTRGGNFEKPGILASRNSGTPRSMTPRTLTPSHTGASGPLASRETEGHDGAGSAATPTGGAGIGVGASVGMGMSPRLTPRMTPNASLTKQTSVSTLSPYLNAGTPPHDPTTVSTAYPLARGQDHGYARGFGTSPTLRSAQLPPLDLERLPNNLSRNDDDVDDMPLDDDKYDDSDDDNMDHYLSLTRKPSATVLNERLEDLSRAAAGLPALTRAPTLARMPTLNRLTSRSKTESSSKTESGSKADGSDAIDATVKPHGRPRLHSTADANRLISGQPNYSGQPNFPGQGRGSLRTRKTRASSHMGDMAVLPSHLSKKNIRREKTVSIAAAEDVVLNIDEHDDNDDNHDDNVGRVDVNSRKYDRNTEVTGQQTHTTLDSSHLPPCLDASQQECAGVVSADGVHIHRHAHHSSHEAPTPTHTPHHSRTLAHHPHSHPHHDRWETETNAPSHADSHRRDRYLDASHLDSVLAEATEAEVDVNAEAMSDHGVYLFSTPRAVTDGPSYRNASASTNANITAAMASPLTSVPTSTAVSNLASASTSASQVVSREAESSATPTAAVTATVAPRDPLSSPSHGLPPSHPHALPPPPARPTGNRGRARIREADALKLAMSAAAANGNGNGNDVDDGAANAATTSAYTSAAGAGTSGDGSARSLVAAGVSEGRGRAGSLWAATPPAFTTNTSTGTSTGASGLSRVSSIGAGMHSLARIQDFSRRREASRQAPHASDAENDPSYPPSAGYGGGMSSETVERAASRVGLATVIAARAPSHTPAARVARALLEHEVALSREPRDGGLSRDGVEGREEESRGHGLIGAARDLGDGVRSRANSLANYDPNTGQEKLRREGISLFVKSGELEIPSGKNSRSLFSPRASSSLLSPRARPYADALPITASTSTSASGALRRDPSSAGLRDRSVAGRRGPSRDPSSRMSRPLRETSRDTASGRSARAGSRDGVVEGKGLNTRDDGAKTVAGDSGGGSTDSGVWEGSRGMVREASRTDLLALRPGQPTASGSASTAASSSASASASTALVAQSPRGPLMRTSSQVSLGSSVASTGAASGVSGGSGSGERVLRGVARTSSGILNGGAAVGVDGIFGLDGLSTQSGEGSDNDYAGSTSSAANVTATTGSTGADASGGGSGMSVCALDVSDQLLSTPSPSRGLAHTPTYRSLHAGNHSFSGAAGAYGSREHGEMEIITEGNEQESEEAEAEAEAEAELSKAKSARDARGDPTTTTATTAATAPTSVSGASGAGARAGAGADEELENEYEYGYGDDDELGGDEDEDYYYDEDNEGYYVDNYDNYADNYDDNMYNTYVAEDGSIMPYQPLPLRSSHPLANTNANTTANASAPASAPARYGASSGATSWYVREAENIRAQASATGGYDPALYSAHRISSVYTNPPTSVVDAEDPHALPVLRPREDVEQEHALMPTLDSLVPPQTGRYHLECVFMAAVQAQLDKVNDFCLTLEEYYESHLRKCVEMCDALEKERAAAGREGVLIPLMRSSKYEELRTTLEEIYRGLHLLDSYQTLNLTGFVKILKKHDKKSSGWRHAQETCLPLIFSTHFAQSTAGARLLKFVESVYVRAFGKAKGDTMKAFAEDHLQQLTPKLAFSIGFFFGIMLTLVIAIVILFCIYPNQSFGSPEFLHAFPIFSCLFQLTFHLWLWGIVTLACAATRVNYALILQLDHKTYMAPLHSFTLAAAYTILLMIAFATFCFYNSSDQTSSVQQYVLFGTFITFMASIVCPFDILYRPTRIFLGKAFFRFIISPFSRATIQETFLGDHLTSLVRMIQDMTYSWCFYTSSHHFITDSAYAAATCNSAIATNAWWLAFAPHFLRLMQCLRLFYKTRSPFPFLVNSGKYLTSCFISILSYLTKQFPGNDGVYYTWIILAIIGTIYSSSWDIFVDWQLLNRHMAAKAYYNQLAEDVEEQGRQDKEERERQLAEDAETYRELQGMGLGREASASGSRIGSLHRSISVNNSSRHASQTHSHNQRDVSGSGRSGHSGGGLGVLGLEAHEQVPARASALIAYQHDLIAPPPASTAAVTTAITNTTCASGSGSGDANKAKEAALMAQLDHGTDTTHHTCAECSTCATQDCTAPDCSAHNCNGCSGGIGVGLGVCGIDNGVRRKCAACCRRLANTGATEYDVEGSSHDARSSHDHARLADEDEATAYHHHHHHHGSAKKAKTNADEPEDFVLVAEGDAAEVLLHGSCFVLCLNRCINRVLRLCGGGNKKKPFVLPCLLPYDLLANFFICNQYMIFYYVMCIINIILRVAWVTSIAPGLIFGLRKEYTLFVVAICEQIRRAIWSYIRLETEHTKNLQSGHAINLDGLDIRSKKSAHAAASAAAIPWVQESYGYGFPLGYIGVADLYQNNMVVEGDGGFYHVEPLMHMPAPAGYGGAGFDDAQGYHGTLEDGEHYDNDGHLDEVEEVHHDGRGQAYVSTYHGERDYAAEGDVEMVGMRRRGARAESDDDDEVRGYGRLHTLLRDDDD